MLETTGLQQRKEELVEALLFELSDSMGTSMEPTLLLVAEDCMENQELSSSDNILVLALGSVDLAWVALAVGTVVEDTAEDTADLALAAGDIDQVSVAGHKDKAVHHIDFDVYLLSIQIHCKM